MADQNRAFGLFMAVGMGALALLHYVWSGTISRWLIGLGILFLVVGLLIPIWLAPARTAWMKLAGVLRFVNSRILLTVLFAGLITPIAVFLRIIGKRPIAHINQIGFLELRYTLSRWGFRVDLVTTNRLVRPRSLLYRFLRLLALARGRKSAATHPSVARGTG